MTRLVKRMCLVAGLGAGIVGSTLVSRPALANEFDGPILTAPIVDAPPAEEPGRVRISDLDAGSGSSLNEKFVPPAPPEDPELATDHLAADPAPTETPFIGTPSIAAPIPPMTESPAVQTIQSPSLVFRASDILRPNVLKGPNYEILEKVTLEKYRFVFEIKTTWGTLEARGMPMLEVRLAEIRAIERAKLISRDPQLIDGILHAIKMTPKGAYVMVTDPVGSVTRLPRGLTRVVMTRYIEADRRAGSDVRRRIAVEIGCDPETSNPILTQLLNEMALQKGIGSLAAQIGMNVAAPGLALLPVTGQFKETLANKLPHEINPQIEAELADLGVKPETRTRFILSANFTTTQRLVFLYYLHKLSGDNKAALVEGAVDTSSESEALSAIHELKLFLDASKSLRPLRYEYQGLPVAVLNDSTNLIVTSADYINASPELDEMLAAYRKTTPDKPTIFYTSGRVAPDTRASFHSAGVQLLQR